MNAIMSIRGIPFSAIQFHSPPKRGPVMDNVLLLRRFEKKELAHPMLLVITGATGTKPLHLEHIHHVGYFNGNLTIQEREGEKPHEFEEVTSIKLIF